MISLSEFQELRPSSGDCGGLCPVGDETLMERIVQRHQAALSELYSRYGQSLRGVIGKVVHEESEAEDVLQESLLQVWHEARSYSPQLGRPLGWIITIARRRAIDRVRRRDSYRRAKERFQDQTRSITLSALKNATHSELAGTDLRRFLGRQLRALPEVQREAVELAYFGGMSQREIAQATGTPLGTVKTRLQLGLSKLAQCLRPLRHKV
jgi:RNA polymerase sigma-70 factor (ECF subfamily)